MAIISSKNGWIYDCHTFHYVGHALDSVQIQNEFIGPLI